MPRRDKHELLIADSGQQASPLSEQYAQESTKPVQGKAEDLVLKGTVSKGSGRYTPLEARTDKLDPPGPLQMRGWEYVAMPPTEFTSEAVLKAFANQNTHWYRGRHWIPISIDLDGDHEGDVRDYYPLMWSIPTKMKFADSPSSAIEITGRIGLRNERCELIETKDWYKVKVWDDHVDNLSHNIRADGFIMHFDQKNQQWIKLNHLRFVFYHPLGRGHCYGDNLPATSYWEAPDNIPNTSAETMYGDMLDDDPKNNYPETNPKTF